MAIFTAQRDTPSSHISRTTPPQVSAFNAINSSAQSSLHTSRTASQTWDGKSRYALEARAPGDMSMLTEMYPTPLNPDERHTVVTCGERSGPSQLTDSSPHELSTGTWRSLHFDTGRTSSCRDVGGPLSLDIPEQIREPPKTATSTTSPENRLQHYEVTKRSNILPPIAHLKQHGGPLYSAVNDIVGASISASPSCRCAAIKPLLYSVIESVTHLRQRLHSAGGNVANYGGPEYPDGSPVHNVQWILDQLRGANSDLDTLFFSRKTGNSRDLQATQSLPSPGELKRKGDYWDGTDEAHKRARFGPSSELPDNHSVSDRSERARGEQSQGYSPTPTDSLPGSVYPRNVSPSQPHRAMRALPSPSSIAVPGSAGSTLPALAAHSIGSPATSYQAAASTNTFTTSSVTSAHIADLQHQVTLKSLALQTLQSEYASLLQKLQREKVKSQTIERKTTVADQEVNELTSKNEDLAEQLKQVTTQLEESEKKRDMERVEAQREKDQWGRMLEMSGRLQAKVDTERQRLLAEKEELLSRISQSEQDRTIVSKSWQTTNPKAEQTDTPSHNPIPMGLESAPNSAPASETSMMRQHIAALNARIEALKTALSHIRIQSVNLGEKTQLLHQQSGALNELIADALKADKGPG